MTLSLEELEKPKPCPRCEFDKPEVYSECEDFDDLVYRVNCGYCGFKSKRADNETQAIIYWNESLAQELRADLNAAKAENEKLREGLKPFAIHAKLSFSSCEDNYPLSFIDIEDNSISAANITVDDLRNALNLIKGGE